MTTPRALLIDLDGLIYQDDEVVPGARGALAWVRAHAIPQAFVTNTTSRPRRGLVEKPAGFGMPAGEPSRSSLHLSSLRSGYGAR